MDFDTQYWEAIKKAALLGTDRGRLSGRVLHALYERGVSKTHPAQQLVLEGAALFHQLNRTAAGPEAFTGSLPPAPRETEQRYLDRRSAYHLQLILEGRFRPALPEFIRLLVEKERQFPPESLPALFEQALTDPAFWRTIEPAIGPAGRWLIERHPQWRELTPAGPWSTGTSLQRQRLLAHLRETDPAQARELLSADWAQLDFREKAGFLDLFEAALSPADEPFLEACLDDRRQEVRRRAADLLAHLEEAALPQRLFKTLSRYLQVGDDGTLQVELPADLEAALLRDGITEKPPAGQKTGRKEGWLLQMLARVPPARWTEAFKTDPAGCIRLFQQAGRPVHWLAALGEAALRYRDPAWMEALLFHWNESGLEGPWKDSLAEQLMDALPADAFARLALHSFRRHGRLPEAGSLAAHLLSRGRHDWPEQLSVQFIRALKWWLAEQPPFQFATPAYRAQLEAAAYRSDPQLLEQLRRGWPLQAPSWKLWEKDVENFLNTLMFRREMRRSLE